MIAQRAFMRALPDISAVYKAHGRRLKGTPEGLMPTAQNVDGGYVMWYNYAGKVIV